MADRSRLYDDEADQDEPEDDKFQDSSEEDDEEDDFEQDDFIVADDGQDAEQHHVRRSPMHPHSDDDAPELVEVKKKKKKKKKRYREDSPELEEGDLQILREGGVRVDRKKKLRRLRKGASDEDDNAFYDDDVRVTDDEDDDGFKERRRAAEEPVDYDDDMDDFIDDGGRSRRRRAAERDGLVSSDTVRHARSIFGGVEDVAHYQGADKLFRPGEDADDDNDADYQQRDDADDEHREELPLRTIRERETDKFDDVDDMPDTAPTDLAVNNEEIAKQLGAGVDEPEGASRIVDADIPERLQNHFAPDYVTPNETEIAEESEWIYAKGFRGNPLFSDEAHFDPEEVKRKINVMLSYIHIDNLDIPFIAMYRKDYITPYLTRPVGESFRATPPITDPQELLNTSQVMDVPRGFNSYRYEDFRPGLSFEHKRGVPPGYDDGFGDWSILWHIFDLDKKYGELCSSRRHLLRFAKRAIEKGVPNPVVDEVKDMIPTCDNQTLLNDGERYLRLAVELAEALNQDLDALDDDDRLKVARRRSKYFDFCKRGYRDLAEEFGLSAQQIGENLKGADEYGTGVQVHVPLDAEGDPYFLAGVFARRLDSSISGEPGDAEDKHGERALTAARHILTTEIVAEMQVVQTARRILCKPGTVSLSTQPTHQGISQVGDDHSLRYVNSLSEKKLESFRNTADYALVRRAVEQGYTKMEIVFQPEQLTSFERSLTSAVLAQEVGESSVLVARWNKERLLIVEEAKQILISQMKSEVVHELEELTAVSLRSKLTQAASRRLLLGPGRPNTGEEGCPRVLSFCVTGEEDEDPDALQISRDLEDAKGTARRNGERRMARERLTIVDLDENGEYQNGYELFAGWLRRPMRRDNDASKLAPQVKEQLKAIIARSKAHFIVIGLGSGGRRALRLQSDLMDVIQEMALAKDENRNKSNRMMMLTADEVKTLQKAHEEISDSYTDEMSRLSAIRTSREIVSKYVIIADEFPTRIYARTDCSSIGLTMDAMTLLERRAIGLARMAQEPLWIYCAIGQEEEHAARLQFHPYHFYAEESDRKAAIERALCRAVCANGVDINRVLRLPHTKPMLAYVAGLGAHKAKALIEALENALGEEDRGLLSRKHLWSQDYLGPVVFLSTAAFLRVRDPELHSGGSTRRARDLRRSKIGPKSRGRRRDDDGDGVFDPMDDSRIHPEHYAVAIKIADEALRDDAGRLSVELGHSEEFTESVRMVSAVIDDSSGLQRLALDEYAHHLESRGRGCLYETVKTIASEFQGPFKDYRRQLTSPDPEAIFYIVTHADPVTFRIGSKVNGIECQVRKRKSEDEMGNRIVGISCQLPNDVRGFISPMDFSDERERLPDEDIEKLVPDGSTIACRVSHFVFDRFEAGLTSRASTIQDPSQLQGYVKLVDKMDPAYRPYPMKANGDMAGPRLTAAGMGSAKRTQSKEILRKAMTHLRERAKPIVQHPFFKDITGEEAIQELKGMLPGDIIIRPSQYGRDGIVFSCKFATELSGLDKPTSSDGVFHVDCQMDHDPNDRTIPLRLKVGDNTYEDVEQVLEQYLRPIISNLSESLDHRKFKAGSEASLQSFVSKEKEQNPRSIPYVFGLSELPRRLVLVYIPGVKTVQTEEIQVVPDGYQLRSVLHMNMDVLIAWFKKNMRKGATQRRPVATVEPKMPASPYAAAASPYRGAARSPYADRRSPFREARSPFMAPASPFAAPRSPFNAPRSPFGAPRSPFMAKSTATPARDVPPPPAPSTPARIANLPNPYAYDEPPPPPAPREEPISAAEWNKATLQSDEPPPRVENGGYGRGPSRGRDYTNGRMDDGDMTPRGPPEYRGPPQRGPPPEPRRPPPNLRDGPPSAYGRGPPPDHRTGPPPDFRDGPPPEFRDGPPPEFRDGPPPEFRGGHPPEFRGGPPLDFRGGPPPDRRNGPPPQARGGPQRGPPSRGPPGRRQPPQNRGSKNDRGAEKGGPMPAWRGARPVPAWQKKQQEEAANK